MNKIIEILLKSFKENEELEGRMAYLLLEPNCIVMLIKLVLKVSPSNTNILFRMQICFNKYFEIFFIEV